MTKKLFWFMTSACLLVFAAYSVRGPHRQDQSASASEPDDQLVEPAGDDLAKSHQAVLQKGLDYLAKAQHDDGHWEGDVGQHPVAMTSMAGLALLLQRERGHDATLKVDKYAAPLKKAERWLLSHCRPERDGLIYSEHPSESARYMEGHGLATILLAGLCAGERDGERREALTVTLLRSLHYLQKARSSRGGWHSTSTREGHDFDDIMTTAIQLQALRAVENAGIPIPNSMDHDAEAYLTAAVSGLAKESSLRRRTEVAAALASRGTSQLSKKLVAQEESDEFSKWFAYCQSEIRAGNDMTLGRDELTHYFYSQATFNRSMSFLLERTGEPGGWVGYRKATFEKLKTSQNSDGSWPGGEGLGVGPVYSTAVWCTVLQLDKNRHPSNQAVRAIK